MIDIFAFEIHQGPHKVLECSLDSHLVESMTVLKVFLDEAVLL
jgi:hypothetical protein